ncbi:hypothetical protein AK812_SmicGene29313 [Symbiodinium microadriaticum]|uniref:Uncharacterized protein n=1 Tax=Symbiodinium microadriaticum TaxID=2951 RepID=A0A1Q9D235_SYMMI|nr:hypothetical protein AK812_SmicGene29313 [Symbiodinium microadriaticum]CAE7208053.1 unnamed protein product [Symbiodinium sp. KB8]
METPPMHHRRHISVVPVPCFCQTDREAGAPVTRPTGTTIDYDESTFAGGTVDGSYIEHTSHHRSRRQHAGYHYGSSPGTSTKDFDPWNESEDGIRRAPDARTQVGDWSAEWINDNIPESARPATRLPDRIFHLLFSYLDLSLPGAMDSSQVLNAMSSQLAAVAAGLEGMVRRSCRRQRQWLAHRKMVLVTSTGTSQPRRQQKNEGEKTPAEGETQTGDDTTDQATKEATDAGQAASSSQDVWEVKTGSWNNPVKMAPGITQFERRLGAPMHGLMNAYQKLFPSFKKESLIPRWKTYLGGQGTTGTASDWSCEVQFPAEHKDRILEAWRDVLYDQVKQQDNVAARLNRFLTKAVPSYTDGEEEGIEHWLARFKFENELMEEMAATKAAEAEIKPGDTLLGFVSQGTKRPFDSQAEWDEAVVEAKTSHINRGYDISVYNDEQGVDHGTPPPEHGLTGGQGVACKLESRAGAHRLAEIPPRCLFSVVFSQRISLPQHSRKKGSEFVCSMFAHLP